MLQELSDESRQIGLKKNITKTKVMVVDNTPINGNNVLIENVPGYVYLGQHYSLKEKNQDKEIQRRIMASVPLWRRPLWRMPVWRIRYGACQNGAGPV